MRTWILGLTAALVLGGSEFATTAEPPPAKVQTIYLTVGSTIRLQMTSKKSIQTVINENETVARVSALGVPDMVLVTGLNPGYTRITLIAADGEKEICKIGKPNGSP